MSFSIKITNNKTGETIVNEKNVIAIIGSYTDGNGTGQILTLAEDDLQKANAVEEDED